MDVVYPYKDTGEHTELRFSLRSLANLPHDHVVIAGDCPSFVRNVVHVPVRQHGRNKIANSLANVVAACRLSRLSDDFILMNDDFYVLEFQSRLQPYFRGTLDGYIAKAKRGGMYERLARATDALLLASGVTVPLDYGLHIPMVFNKHRVLELCERFQGRGFLLRSLYHNLYRTGGALRERDVKGIPIEEATDFFSSSNASGQSAAFIEHMTRRFPEACYYEREH